MRILSSICHKSATPWKYLCLFFDFFCFFQIPINRITVKFVGLAIGDEEFLDKSDGIVRLKYATAREIIHRCFV